MKSNKVIIHRFNFLFFFQIVNGERASYAAPKFARMQERTRSQMLEDLVANLQNHAETGQIPKPYRWGVVCLILCPYLVDVVL